MNEYYYFTCHEKIAYKGFMGAIFFVAIIETIGVSFLLYNWNTFLHYLHLFINIIFMLFLFYDTKKVLEQPIRLKENEIHLKFGLRPSIDIEIDNIQDMRSGSLHYEEKRKKKDVLDLSLFVMEEPTIEITFKEPITITKIFGTKKNVSSVFFFIDEKDEFFKEVNKKRKEQK